MYFTSGKDLLQKNKGHNMQNNELLVSVILICKNNKDLIRRPIDSVFEQNYKNIEIVVVDSSNDETINILEEYKSRSPFPFRIIHQEPKGVGIARNTGIENAKGEVVAFVDADCWIDKDFIEKIAQEFSKSDKVLSVFTNEVQIVPTNLFPKLADLYERIMHYDDVVDINKQIATLRARKKLYDIIGMFDPDLEAGEDAELIYRVLKRKKELEKQGYIFSIIPNTTIYEEKQGTGFFEYYKRCIWYGKPLADKKYFYGNPKKNTIAIFLSSYFSILPFIYIYSAVAHVDVAYILLISLPFLALYLYIIIKSILIKKFTPLVFLMPILLLYKFIGLFIGFISGLFHKPKYNYSETST